MTLNLGVLGSSPSGGTGSSLRSSIGLELAPLKREVPSSSLGGGTLNASIAQLVFRAPAF